MTVPLCTPPPPQVVNRLRKAHVLDIIKEFGEDYDRIWIYSKIHHEMNQLCSKSSLQEIYIDKFDQIDEILQSALQVQALQVPVWRRARPSACTQIASGFPANSWDQSSCCMCARPSSAHGCCAGGLHEVCPRHRDNERESDQAAVASSHRCQF